MYSLFSIIRFPKKLRIFSAVPKVAEYDTFNRFSKKSESEKVLLFVLVKKVIRTKINDNSNYK